VNYNARPIPGSPFHFNVESVSSGGGIVTAYGPGLSHGRIREPATFTVVIKNVGHGGLSLAVEGPSKAEIQCRDNGDGTCSASYVPYSPGLYNVSVKFQDRHIPGSPFTATISGDTNKYSQVSVGTTSDVPLKISETDISSLTASVKGPSGREEPCVLKRMPNGHLGISFTPREVGEHLVNVYRAGLHIPNSPFSIFVNEEEIGNASRVRVYGPGVEPHGGMANEVAQFTVDTRDAGYGSLSLSVEGPSKADIECHDNQDGTCLVTYRPTEPGTYLVNVKYADTPVPGSPFAVDIGGEGSGMRMMERITRQRDAVDVTHVGSQCELSLKIPNTNLMDMAATVTSPSGYTELCDIMDQGNGNYSIRFIPREVGVHTVSVKHRGIHIPGSPFQFTVGPIKEGGAHKVRASGPGLIHGVCHSPNEFSVYTREAGAGGLSIAIEGPSKAEIDFEDRKDGSCGVVYRVSEAGDYTCSIKFNDQHIPGSPYRVYVSDTLQQQRVQLGHVQSERSLQESFFTGVQEIQPEAALIGQSTAFTVHCNQVDVRNLRASVQSPSGHESEALIQQVDHNQYAIRFVPEESGPHLIHVMHRDTQQPILGSPFRVVVNEKFTADPGMVFASGEGLTHGRVNEKNNFFVNTVHAGSGALSVTIDGPSKVQLNCHEEQEGYFFTYVPTVPGEYLITIKYGGNFHIVGSPFKAIITGSNGPYSPAADPMAAQSHVIVETVDKLQVNAQQRLPTPTFASQSHADRVRCQGMALKRAFVGRENQFNVDASQAGTDILLIGLAGPLGPIDEVHVRHLGQQRFSVAYTVKDRGAHILMVKWGDEHVPGSPFMIDVP
jgi:filamin